MPENILNRLYTTLSLYCLPTLILLPGCCASSVLFLSGLINPSTSSFLFHRAEMYNSSIRPFMSSHLPSWVTLWTVFFVPFPKTCVSTQIPDFPFLQYCISSCLNFSLQFLFSSIPQLVNGFFFKKILKHNTKKEGQNITASSLKLSFDFLPLISIHV